MNRVSQIECYESDPSKREIDRLDHQWVQALHSPPIGYSIAHNARKMDAPPTCRRGEKRMRSQVVWAILTTLLRLTLLVRGGPSDDTGELLQQ